MLRKRDWPLRVQPLPKALGGMLFYVETETCELSTCDEKLVMGECEALDVEAALYLFWDETGAPLEPEFTVPSKRGLFTATNGEYKLVPASENHHAHLLEALNEISVVEIDPPLNTIDAVREHILRNEKSSP